tara:strand:+ start:524 stop:1237 length:714 start_codon:yes stop_codon:yes gene_type:complete
MVNKLLTRQFRISGQPDLIVLVGDIGGNYLVPKSSSQPEEKKYLKSLIKVLETVASFDTLFVWISGNHDYSPQKLQELEIPYLNNHLELNPLIFNWGQPNQYFINGIGGCPSPHGFPYEYLDDYNFKTKIEKTIKKSNILISHAPPYGTTDLVSRGINAGSRIIKECLDHTEKDTLVLCGHIHEAVGSVKYKNQKRKTINVVNCGSYGEPFPNNELVIIQINKNFELDIKYIPSSNC